MTSTSTNSRAGRLQRRAHAAPGSAFHSLPSVYGHREGIRDPSFSNLIYALRKFNKVQVTRDHVYINVNNEVGGLQTFFEWGKVGMSRPAAKRPLLSVQVRVYLCDQWRRPRAPQQETPPPASGPRTPVNPVLTPKKRLATEVINQLKQNR